MDSCHKFYQVDDPRRFGRRIMPKQREVTLRWMASCCACPSEAVVELGCGMGALSDVHPSYVGLELSANALQEFSTSARRVQGDMQQLPFQAARVGFLFSWSALEHVPTPEAVLKEIERVMRPGGVALIAPAWNCRS